MKEDRSIGAQAFLDIFPDALQGLKNEVRTKSHKAPDADIPDIGGFARRGIVNGAKLDNRKVSA
jgi:hypothetical protein